MTAVVCIALPAYSTFSSCLIPRHPSAPLFPYTTLFRSQRAQRADIMRNERIVRRMGREDRPRAVHLRLSFPRHRAMAQRSEEHTSELQSLRQLVCRLLLEKKNVAGNVIAPVMKGKLAGA